MSTCEDALCQIGGEIAKAWEDKQSDEDALVAIDEIVAEEVGREHQDGGSPDAAMARARNGRVSGPDDGADDELLIDGQEEVFSRTEVELGVIEHHSLEENSAPDPEHAPDPQRPDGGPADGAD